MAFMDRFKATTQKLTGGNAASVPGITSMQNQNPTGVQNPMDSATTTPNVSNALVNNQKKVAKVGSKPVATVPVKNFMNRFQDSPQGQIMQSQADLMNKTAQGASAKATQSANQQAAALGLDPNSAAYRRLMSQTRDAGTNALIEGRNEAALNTQKGMEDFRQEELAKATTAFEMMDLNEDAQTAFAQALASGADLTEFVSGLSDTEGNILGDYQSDPTNELRDDYVSQYMAYTPEATQEEAEAWAANKMQEDWKAMNQPTETAAMEADVRDTILSGGDTSGWGTEEWAKVNEDEQLKQIMGDSTLGDWWHDKKYFDDNFSGKIVESQVRGKLDQEGITEGGYMMMDGSMKEVQTIRMNRLDKGRLGETMEVKIQVYDPMTKETKTVTKEFRR